LEGTGGSRMMERWREMEKRKREGGGEERERKGM